MINYNKFQAPTG